MTDIFDAKIHCKRCDKVMEKDIVEKNGLEMRAVKCPYCGDVIIHPADLNSLEHYKDLKGKTFNVKLRVVGNSHAISIPKEIVDFMSEMNDVHSIDKVHDRMRKEMQDMVRLCFEDFGKLSVRFGNMFDDSDEDELKRKLKNKYDPREKDR